MGSAASTAGNSLYMSRLSRTSTKNKKNHEALSRSDSASWPAVRRKLRYVVRTKAGVLRGAAVTTSLSGGVAEILEYSPQDLRIVVGRRVLKGGPAFSVQHSARPLAT